MNAAPLLEKIARTLTDQRLEVVMVGNAAAAIRGAPVTTLDFDFMFRKTPANLKKLKRVATDLDATILKPYYPVSDLYRVVGNNATMQLDFLATLHGIRSFAGLRSRADNVQFGDGSIWIASLRDIIKSKRAAGRPRDLAVLNILEKTLDETDKLAKGSRKGAQEGKRKSAR